MFFFNFKVINLEDFLIRNFKTLFLIMIQKTIEASIKKRIENPKYLFSIGIVGVTSSLLLLATLQTSTNYGDYSFYGVFINNVYLPIIGIAPILLNLSRHQSTSSMILGSKFFTSLGKASYLFYLLHIGFTKKIYFQYDNNIFFYFVVMNVLCIVLFYKVEEPLTLKIKAFLKL